MNFEIFKGKRILVFLPHEDDELNTIYGLLFSIRKKAKNLKVVYSTNGNSVIASEYRIKEAINSLKRVGISKENIIFLGYSDQIPEGNSHMYNEKVWLDVNNKSHTSTPLNNDYNYIKHGVHAEFNRENLEKNIKEIIEEEIADFLFCIDYDSHPDHKALSLCFESSLGKVLKEKEYNPIVYKMFAYPTSYKGKCDFHYNNPSTKFVLEDNCIENYQNPYYSWSERVRFAQPEVARKYMLLKNIYFWGLLEHKSQYIFNRIEQIINSDMIFFQRDTTNLLYKAKIKTSSGNGKYLNDFMLFDTSDILKNDLNHLNEGYTIFEKEDKKKEIEIFFKEKIKCEKIRFYIKPSDIKNLSSIIVNNRIINNIDIKKNNILDIDGLNIENIKELKIKFILKEEKEFGIGEIELIKDNTKIKYAKLTINDDFVYDYYYKDTKPIVNLYTNYQLDDLVVEEQKNKKGYRIILKNNNRILDTINLIKLKKHNKLNFEIIKILNKIAILGGRVFQKVVKTKRKMLSKILK